MEFERVLRTLTDALDDYTTDQRGDVGSWVRAASVRSLAQVLAGVCSERNALQLVPQELFAPAVAGIVKQAFEKLDVVRDAATDAWGELLHARADRVWSWPSADAMAVKEAGARLVRPSAEWFTFGLEVLRTPVRPTAVAGLVQSAGAVVHSTSERCLRPLIPWLRAHDERDAVLADMVDVLAAQLMSNRVAVPTLTTLSRLLDAGVAPADEETVARMLGLAARGLTTLKSIDRIVAAMKVIIGVYALEAYPETRRKSAGFIGSLLSHRFPRVSGRKAVSN